MCWRKWEPCVSRVLLLMGTFLTSKWPFFFIVSSSKDNHGSYFKGQLLGSNQELVLSQNKRSLSWAIPLLNGQTLCSNCHQLFLKTFGNISCVTNRSHRWGDAWQLLKRRRKIVKFWWTYCEEVPSPSPAPWSSLWVDAWVSPTLSPPASPCPHPSSPLGRKTRSRCQGSPCGKWSGEQRPLWQNRENLRWKEESPYKMPWNGFMDAHKGMSLKLWEME